jgi:hypothetical protein
MKRSGLIFAVVALVLGLAVTLLSPLVVPCVGFVIGLVAGYLGSVFDKPADSPRAANVGTKAGLIAAAGAVLGQLGGGLANALLMGPEAAARLMGRPAAEASSEAFAIGYYGGICGTGVCLSVVDVGLMAGLGALGGLLWWQLSGRKRSAAAPVVENLLPPAGE